MNGGEDRTNIGVIFDLDGTLADTLDDIVDSINHVYGQIGQASVPHETVRPFIGIGLLDLVRRTSGIDDTETILGLVDQYRSVYTERMLRKTQLYAGMDSVLDMLAELRSDNQALIAALRETHDLCAAEKDVGTTSSIEVWIDQAERRVWFLYEASRRGDPTGH